MVSHAFIPYLVDTLGPFSLVLLATIIRWSHIQTHHIPMTIEKPKFRPTELLYQKTRLCESVTVCYENEIISITA